MVSIKNVIHFLSLLYSFPYFSSSLLPCHLLFLKDFLMWTLFRDYRICYNIASIFFQCFGSFLMRHVGS